MKNLYIVAYTHKTIDFSLIGTLHTPEEQWEQVLPQLKEEIAVEELMMISTCNRVEFILVSNKKPCPFKLLTAYKPVLGKENIAEIASKAEIFEQKQAIEHLFRVASSMESLVVGEREIITQFREAYEKCNLMGITGDSIRLAAKQTIEAAKRVYSETNIATKQVSVVSLAFQKLMELNPNLNSKVLVIGAGVTNGNMVRFLKKNKFGDVHIFNRTLSKAQQIAIENGFEAHNLEELNDWVHGFDILITCTDSSLPLINNYLYRILLNSSENKKIVVDLSLPGDLEKSILQNNPIEYIHFQELKKISEENLQFRQAEISNCEKIIQESIVHSSEIFKIREVEIAMQEIPRLVKEIKENAMSLVFAKDLAKLDDESRDVVEKIMEYVEKKYISLPMKKAKEILLEKV